MNCSRITRLRPDRPSPLLRFCRKARLDDQWQGAAATSESCGPRPGQARDDWEILRDLIQAYSGQNGIYSIEDVFRQMSESVPHWPD